MRKKHTQESGKKIGFILKMEHSSKNKTKYYARAHTRTQDGKKMKQVGEMCARFSHSLECVFFCFRLLIAFKCLRFMYACWMMLPCFDGFDGILCRCGNWLSLARSLALIFLIQNVHCVTLFKVSMLSLYLSERLRDRGLGTHTHIHNTFACIAHTKESVLFSFISRNFIIATIVSCERLFFFFFFVRPLIRFCFWNRF